MTNIKEDAKISGPFELLTFLPVDSVCQFVLLAVLVTILLIIFSRLLPKILDKSTSFFNLFSYFSLLIILLAGLIYCLRRFELSAFFPVDPVPQFLLFTVSTVLFIITFSRFLAKIQEENLSTLRSLSYFPLVLVLYEVSVYCLWRLVSPVYQVDFRNFSKGLILTTTILAFLFATYDLWAHKRASKKEMVMLTVFNAAIIAFIMYL